ncbi:MAG: tetratricopeptide repeat protein, partial [Planctomycetales bacterium]|nr:tetratricopeptide repeat protein [Planctomycetales bacterium]
MTRPHPMRAWQTQQVHFAGIIVCIAALMTCVFMPLPSIAQDSGPVDVRERVAVDRYLQVLLGRPRLGVALDRVYGYHVQNDTLDELQQQLSDKTAADYDQRQMVWGLVQLQRGRSAEAATILADVESKLTDDAACSYYLGRAYLAIGQTELAAAAMERAITRGPSRAEALPMFTELGRIYSRAGELQKSLSVWTRLEKLFPGDTRVGSQIARTLAEEGNHEQAMIRYERLSEVAKKDDEKIAFEVQAAEMQRHLGKADQATGQLEKILARLRPGSWLYTDVRNRIEDGFLKSGDYDALADYYQNQLNERPDDLALQTRLSRIMITAGRLTEAQSQLQSAIAKAPDDTETRLTLIEVLINQNDIAAATEQFEELFKRDPSNPDHLIRWGQVLLDDATKPLEQRRSEAAAVWNRLAQSRTDDAVTIAQIADRMRGIDRSKEAIGLYQKSIDLDPGAPQYREYLGEYLYSLDRVDEAIEVWKSIAADDRRGRESLVRLAEIYGTFKRPDLALDAWAEASQFDLTFAQELRYAAKLTEAKQYDNALVRLDSAEKIAETPDEHEQLLNDRISVYQSSGTLAQQIRQVSERPETIESLRTLALMFGANGDLNNAERAIRKAIAIEPDNTQVLLVAADLAERQNRLGDAAEFFGKLASVDSRFRTNYLQRVASLEIRLGQTDQAMKTCERIIDANPASPESYQFYARTALAVNRDEEAIAALRRAMSVAPRDNSSRRMLADHFADRYRTDEAIELYWQAFQYEPKTDDKINVIQSLAPLYDRKADLDTLLGRIEEINRKEGDARTKNLMVAAAHESVQEFAAARNAIDQLLAVQPRDVALLETMVRLSDAADEVELAAEFQRRITELADTPENRFKLFQFQLDAGTIDVAEVLSQRLAFVTDPTQLGGIVRSAIRRGDLNTAREICNEILRSDDSLWDIKLTLAQLLMIDRNNETGAANREQAIQLAQQVRALHVEMDAAPPTQRRQTTTRATTNGLPAGYQSNPLYWSQSSYQLASILRVGQYANRSYSSSGSTTTLDPTSYGHARVIAASIILMDVALDKTGDDAGVALQAKFDKEFALPELDQITDPIVLWEHFTLTSVISVMTNQQMIAMVAPGASAAAKTKADELRQKQMKIMWRLAELDKAHGIGPLLQMLAQRMMSGAMGGRQQVDMTPLTEDELKTLARINNEVQATGMSSALAMGLPKGAGEMMMQAIMGFEFRLAGQEKAASEFEPKVPGDDAEYDEIFGAIQFYLQLNETEKAGGLVKHLLAAARRSRPSSSIQGMNPTLQIMMNSSEAAKEFNASYQKEMVDAVIARWAKQSLNTANRSASLGDGHVSTYSQVGGGLRSIRVRGPLSTRLLDSSLAQQVLAFAATDGDESTARQPTQKIQLSTELIKHLETPLSDASPDEAKTRLVVAAFAHWWADNPEQCYESLIRLSEQFPADVDLQIERARLASELKQPRVALETLDSFSPLDSGMLIRKEMAAMNLAAEIGDTARAKVAAERLFGMRLDVQMQLALADQLKRLGLNEQATAMLQRTRSSRARDESTELQIANAFLNAGDK